MKRGMSLIETMVWVGVFTAIMFALINTVLYFYKTNRYAMQQGSAVTSVQRGIDHMVRTIREAAYSNNGAYPIVSMSASQITFYANINNDQWIEKVHYYIQNNVLYEGIITPSGDPAVYTNPEVLSDLSDYVRNVAQNVTMLTYYDKNGTQITDYTKVGDVRFVSITVIADVNPNDAPGTLTLHSTAALRNLVGK
jgi:hypothetical protein